MPKVAPGFLKPASLATERPLKNVIRLIYSIRLALLSYYRALAHWLIPATKNHPHWTVKQCISITEIQVDYAWVSWTRHSPPATLDPDQLGPRLVQIPPAPQNLLAGPMTRDSTIKPDQIRGVWYPSAYDPSTDKTKRVILEFHVGGYTTAPSNDSFYEAGAKAVADTTNSKVLVVFYRLCSAPGQHFPAQLQDALSAFHYATHSLGIDPSRIVLSGDSAGGHLVLTFLRYLAEYGASKGIPRPGAALVVSCMLDLHQPTQKTLFEHRNYNTDMVRKEHIDWSIETFVPGDMSTDDKWISPGRYPFAMPVPTYFEAGMLECLGPDIVTFANKCKEMTEADTEVEIHAIESGTHASLWLGGIFGFDKEQEDAIEAVDKFLARVGL